MHWMRAGTSLLLSVIWMGGTLTGNPCSKPSLNDGCYFPGTEGNQTQTHAQIKLIVSKYVLCFPVHFFTSFRDPLDLEANCISLDFISNGSIDRYFIITSRLYLLLTSCQRTERLPTFPLWLRVHLSSTESRFMYAAEKLKIFSYHVYLFLLK